MRITIDTKKDSIEEIEKVIALVREIIGVGSGESSSNDFSMPEGGVMGMFGSSSNSSEESSEEKKDDDNPGIMTY